ncbi:lipoprotein [Bordetella pertussis]|nr:lipoprotein [Bordetella pertussis]
MRGGTGERVRAIAQGQASVPASALKPLIDEWTDNVAREIRNYVRSK